jgi:hypothetical protein
MEKDELKRRFRKLLHKTLDDKLDQTTDRNWTRLDDDVYRLRDNSVSSFTVVFYLNFDENSLNQIRMFIGEET